MDTSNALHSDTNFLLKERQTLSRMVKAFLFVFCLIALGHSVNGLNMRPIIGILDKPCSGDAPYLEPYGNSYFTADYVKWLQSGGARVVPIPHNLPPQYFFYFDHD